MLTQPTLQQLRTLKLSGMTQAFEEYLNHPQQQALSFQEQFAIVVDRETLYRNNRRLERLKKAAQLRFPNACAEDIDYEHERKLPRNKFTHLLTCEWVQNHQNVIFLGPTGSGKTYLACALAEQACRNHFSALYVRVPLLIEKLRISHGDGTFLQLLNQLAKVDLLIADDLGCGVLSTTDQSDFLEIIESRHQLKSTLIMSQLSIKRLHEFFNESILADAILDRLVHGAHIFEFDRAADSLRKKQAQAKEKKNVDTPQNSTSDLENQEVSEPEK